MAARLPARAAAGTPLGTAAVEHLQAGRHGVLLGLIGGRASAKAYEDVLHMAKPLDPQLIQLAQLLAR